jgi:hypothetical protein
VCTDMTGARDGRHTPSAPARRPMHAWRSRHAGQRVEGPAAADCGIGTGSTVRSSPPFPPTPPNDEARRVRPELQRGPAPRRSSPRSTRRSPPSTV